ncbi:MAG: hypothetical protein ACLFUP_08975 [Desulfobacteraceae bacterium]
MVKISARLKPYRKMDPMIPADARPPALKKFDELRKKMGDGTYDRFLDPATRAELQRAMKNLQQLAVDVGGVRTYASFGATVTIIDVFDRTDKRERRTEKWHWSLQHTTHMPLNIGLVTRVPDGDYLVLIGTKDPDWNEQGEVPVFYQYRASRESYPPHREDYKCSGRSPVDLTAGHLNLFSNVPDGKMVFKGKEKTLIGRHNWGDYGGGKLGVASDVFGPDPECKGATSGAKIAPLHLESKEFLDWKFERVCK